MYITILGRQPSLSVAELERYFGAENTRWFSSTTATVNTDTLSIEKLGGTLKAGVVTLRPSGNWKQVSQAIASHYSHEWRGHDGKITLGISVYGFDTPPREVQRIGLIIKSNLKKSDTSLRLIPNAEAALNTATSHHNKLGLSPNKVELLIVKGESGKHIVAESTGAQNITALAARDQARPRRDAFVGMLPPKLALLMINLAAGDRERVAPSGAAPAFEEISPRDFSKDGADSVTGPAPSDLRANSKRIRTDGSDDSAASRLLDPFCGTGVVLQEAALLGYQVYGTDLSEKMIHYSRDNINWLEQSHHLKINSHLHEGDAMTTEWQQPIDLVVSETYLGQPFSAPPSPKKLEEVKGNVNHITTTFLKNLRSQIQPGTPLCLAVPAWRGADGRITHLPFIRTIDELGFQRVTLKNVRENDLVYYREDQVVARELLILVAS